MDGASTKWQCLGLIPYCLRDHFWQGFCEPYVIWGITSSTLPTVLSFGHDLNSYLCIYLKKIICLFTILSMGYLIPVLFEKLQITIKYIIKSIIILEGPKGKIAKTHVLHKVSTKSDPIFDL